jgi:sugar (pentulose or hexulose) kinase
MRNIVDTMSGPDAITQLRGCGGVTKDKTWLQIISDVTNKPIVLTKNSRNAGVLGCSIISAVGSGNFVGFDEACEEMVKKTDAIHPDPARYVCYEEPYRKYLDLYRNLKNLF